MTVSAGNVTLRVDATLPLGSDVGVCAAELRVTLHTVVHSLHLRVGDWGRHRSRPGRCRRGLCRLLRLVAALADVICAAGMVLRNLWRAPHSFLVTSQAFLPALQGVRNGRRAFGRPRRRHDR